MADNVIITAGSGTTIHADEYTHTTLGSGKSQLVKLVDGTLDSDTAIGVPDIGVKANAIRVCPANDITDGTYIGDIKFGEAEPNSAAILADTSSIDGKITACNTGAVVISSGTITTVSAVTAITNALPAGTNNIGDVDVLSCVGIAAEAAALGSGILIQGDDGTDRKNINVDATTGDVQVDVTNTVTVDCNSSNVTEVNSAAILADTAAMDTNLATIAGAVSTEMQCDIVAALPVGDNVIGRVKISDGTEVANVNTNNRLEISIEEDNAGIGGGTQYTEDAAAAADPVGNAQILVRLDTPAAITSTDGDNIARRATNFGAAYCQILDSSGNFIDTFGGAGGTSAADDADFVAGTTQGTPSMGVYESSPSSVTDGDLGIVGITATRSLKVEETNSTAILADTANMDTNLGTIAGAVAAGQMQVDIVADGAGLATESSLSSIDGKITACNTGAVVISSGTITTVSAVTAITNALPAGTNNIGDVDVLTVPAPLNVTGGGTEATALRVTLANDSTGTLTVDTTGTSGLEVIQSVAADLNVTEASASAILTAVQIMDDWDDGSDNCKVVGSVAHDAADSGNPVKVGGVAYNLDGSAPGTAVAEADRVNFIADIYGRQFVETTHPNLGSASENNSTAQTNNELVAAPGAGLSIYITDIVMSTDTAMNIKLVENTGTPTDIKGPYYFAANGGMAKPQKTPIKLTANTNLGYTSSAAGNHTVEVEYFIAP